MPFSNREAAGAVATGCCIIQILFQLSLALGLPFGKAAWGGSVVGLSTGLRVGSAVAFVVYLFLASVILQRAGFKDFGYSEVICRRTTGYLTSFLIFETLLNFASRSPLERFLWGPFALVFAVSCFVLTRGDEDRRGQGEMLTERDYLVAVPP